MGADTAATLAPGSSRSALEMLQGVWSDAPIPGAERVEFMQVGSTPDSLTNTGAVQVFFRLRFAILCGFVGVWWCYSQPLPSWSRSSR